MRFFTGMKRAAAGVLICCMALVLAGCGGAASSLGSSEPASSAVSSSSSAASSQMPASSGIPKELLPSDARESNAPSAVETPEGESKASAGGVGGQAVSQPGQTVPPAQTPAPGGEASAPPRGTEGGGTGTPASSEAEPPREPEPPPPPAQITVSLTVDASNANGSVPASGMQLTLAPGSTVWDALAQSGVPFVGGGGYVEGIAGIFEKDYGSQSGWLYFVNGVSPGIASSGYTLQNGDSVAWRYTLNLGKDLA